ncbi:MAG: transporter [Rhodobacterales bacterium]|nr:MAG: transporter [Rhodobacterales bacterium]
MQASHRQARLIAAAAALALLTACDGMPEVPRLGLGGKDAASAPQASASDAALDPGMADGSQSEIINTLLARRSVLDQGAFARVSDAVMAANARAAEADLRAAVLRSEATQRNWLPTVGPQVSLTSLGDVMTQLVVDQVLFDNGGKRAERALARADVEVAAVALAQDSNTRVADALSLYLEAEAASARAKVNAGAMERMEHFEWVMTERVRGGINDRSDLSIVTQRLTQMRSDLSSDRERAASAKAELAAMSAVSLADISGLSGMRDAGEITPLSVLKAEAEAKRAVAQARAARAGLLPSLGVSAVADGDGVSGALTGGGRLGFGTGKSLEAVQASEAAAQARVGQAREEADRELRGLSGELASMERQYAEAQGIAAQAAQNYDLFEAQLEAGRRTVPEVIGVFETKIRTERAAVSLLYDIARLRVKIAALKGALVEGEKV